MLKHALYCSFLFGMVQYPVALNAQKKLQTTIIVPNKSIRVDELFDLFSKEADLEFSINSKRINLAQMIYVTHHSQTVNGWLQDLSVAAGISYKIKGDHVILEDQKTIVAPVKVAVVTPTPEAEKEKSEEDKKINEGLINLIKEDLHTVYGQKEKKSVDRSIHPADNDKALMPATDTSISAPKLQGLVKLDFGPAGFAIGSERRIGHRMMIDLSVGLGGGYGMNNSKVDFNYGSGISAFVSINPRYYLNRKKLAAAGRPTTLNAGSYIGFRLKAGGPLEIETNGEFYLANIHFGMQRPVARKWLLNAHAGIGYALASSEYWEFNRPGFRFFYPALECRISYVVNKPRK